MRQHSLRWWLSLVAVSMAVIVLFAAAAQSLTSIESTYVRVYRDGLVHVKQTLTLDSTAPQTEATLLSSEVENLVILDENQLAVDYEADGETLLIYSFGASKAQVEYDTNTLTSKANEVWTLRVENPYDLTVVFPVNSSVIYLSDAPAAIETVDNEVNLHLNSGQWEISYLLQLVAQDQNNQIPTQSNSPLPLEYLLITVGCALFAVVLSVSLFFAKRKRRFNVKKALNENPQLMKEDKEVLQFLAEKEGHAFEAEIRQRFPDMPRTSLWRLVKRLEKLELVEVKKVGLENQVSLKK
ncbi:MAG: helix-turn-helix transcriptional regulator [Candidatus Bathyarchaeia archaeon]|jgi:uncharacterized membrane protein